MKHKNHEEPPTLEELIQKKEEWLEDSVKNYRKFLQDKTRNFVQKHRSVVVVVCKKCGFRAGNLPYPKKGRVHCPRCNTFLYEQV